MKNGDHLFKLGESGNPLGRPRGARNRATVAAELLLDGESEALTRRCVDMALAGDHVALRLCLSRILPVKRERTLELDLPDLGSSQGSLRAIATVLEAVGSGAITPSEGQSVAGLLETYRRSFEIEELERRIGALEERVCGAN
jgi:hypothetical protein